MHLRTFLASDYFFPSPGTTFMTNSVALSFGPNGPGTLFFTSGMDLEKYRDRRGVVLGEVGEGAPRHDWRQVRGHPAACRSAMRQYDLIDRPLAETGVRIGCQIRAVEYAKAWNLEAYLRAAEITRHVRLAEEIPRRVAVDTASEFTKYLPRSTCACWAKLVSTKPNPRATPQTPTAKKRTTMRMFLPSALPSPAVFNLNIPIALRGRRHEPQGALSPRALPALPDALHNAL